MKQEFRKRTYAGLREWSRDLWYVLRRTPSALRIAMGSRVSHLFRERLMLVVTGVNECRFCTSLHSRAASAAGVDDGQIRSLLRGELDGVPDTELPALRYALAWAETNGKPDLQAWQTLIDAYGDDLAEAVELTLRMIRFGNLTGNSLEKLFA